MKRKIPIAPPNGSSATKLQPLASAPVGQPLLSKDPIATSTSSKHLNP
jgi:hypothetical protein